MQQVSMVGLQMAALRLTKLSDVQQGTLTVRVATISFSMVIVLVVVVVVFSIVMMVVVNCVLKRRRLKKNVEVRLEEDSGMLSAEG